MIKFVTSKDFIGTSIEKSLASDNDLEKGGEGSRGGKIIGHTKSGKPVYVQSISSKSKYRGFTKDDHEEASKMHEDLSNLFSGDKKVHHETNSLFHKMEADKKEETLKEPETSIPFKVGKVQDHHDAADVLEEFGHKIDRKNMTSGKHGDTIFHDEKGRKAGVMSTDKILSVHHYDDLTKGNYSELEVDKELLLEPFVEKLEKSLESGEIKIDQFLKSLDDLEKVKNGEHKLKKGIDSDWSQIVSQLNQLQLLLEHCHRQTKSEPKHEALGDAYEAFAVKKDEIIEHLIGLSGEEYGILELEGIPEFTSEMADDAAQQICDLSTTLDEISQEEGFLSISNLAQDLYGVGAKLKYKLSLNNSGEK